MKHRVKHIHFVGIGGVGMSGIAEVLLTLGYTVSGSDTADNTTTQRLVAAGARVYFGHDATYIAGANVVVTSTAVKTDNPEVQAALAAHIPIVPRAMMLAELMRFKQGIAIAGTHGKTTTTSLVASVLAAAGLDPTFVIGGKLTAAGTNARLGAGEFLVAEADESDASFLHLQPIMAVVTNIDADHMDTYDHSLDKLKQAFVDFLHHLPFYGRAVLCIDDANVRSILPLVKKPMTTYGVAEDADFRAENIVAEGGTMHFDAVWHNGSHNRVPIVLNTPGHHNVLNALATIAIAVECGADVPAIQAGLSEFSGVGRRFQRFGELPLPNGGTATLVDDYGHHPVEMAATLAAVIFQVWYRPPYDALAGGRLLFLLLVGGMMAGFYWNQPSLPEHADYYPAGRDINPFAFTDQDGQPFVPASLTGHWTFLFVGYTFCPDICPTTLADLRSVYPELKKIAPSSQVVFISADPQRDDVARLKTYTAFFNPEFKAATGPQIGRAHV